MIDLFQNLPPELLTVFLGMLPIFELRGAIPVALGVYGLSAVSAFFFAVLGNLIPVIFLLLFLEPLSKYLGRRSLFFNRFFAWLFEKTRREHAGKFEIWKEVALIFLVAVPLPFTGAWTGSLAAFVFGIPKKRAFVLIAAGVVVSGLLVTLITLGAIQFI